MVCLQHHLHFGFSVDHPHERKNVSHLTYIDGTLFHIPTLGEVKQSA
jgi:hypothetical protein